MPKQRVFTNSVLVEEIDLPEPPAVPAALSKTQFIDTAIAGIVSTGLTQGAAEARFQEIIEAAKNFAGTTEQARRVRYAYERYAAATAFDKTLVGGLLSLFVAAGVASMTGAERTAILAAWRNQ
jgi:hypothetical protein